LWKPLKEDFDRIISQLKKHILLVDNEATVTGFEHNQEKLEQAFTGLEKLVTNCLRYSEKAADEQRRTQEILNALQFREVTCWLSADNPQKSYEAALQRIHPSTGAWLLSLHEFHAWLAAPKNQVLPVLWIHGAPG
jgi:nitrogen-specific signal transduction histidine kinase